MVDLGPVIKRSGIQMVVLKPDYKKPVYGPKCLVFEWFAKSHMVHMVIPNYRIILTGETCLIAKEQLCHNDSHINLPKM